MSKTAKKNNGNRNTGGLVIVSVQLINKRRVRGVVYGKLLRYDESQKLIPQSKCIEWLMGLGNSKL